MTGYQNIVLMYIKACHRSRWPVIKACHKYIWPVIKVAGIKVAGIKMAGIKVAGYQGGWLSRWPVIKAANKLLEKSNLVSLLLTIRGLLQFVVIFCLI